MIHLELHGGLNEQARCALVVRVAVMCMLHTTLQAGTSFLDVLCKLLCVCIVICLGDMSSVLG